MKTKKVSFISVESTGDGKIILKTFHGDFDILTREGEIISSKVTRASWVVPWSPMKRWAFRVLRKIFGDTGPIARWTRTWGGEWGVILAHERNIIHGPFSSREEAIAWERRAVVKREMEV